MDYYEIIEHLCYRDPRSPYFEDIYGFLDEEDRPEPREDCDCDSCCQGRDELALELLRVTGLDKYVEE